MEREQEIKNLLHITGDESVETLLELFNQYCTVSANENQEIRKHSVLTLPSIVKNREEELKNRMVGIVTDTNYGMISLMDKRNVILQELTKKIHKEAKDVVQGYLYGGSFYYDEYHNKLIQPSDRLFLDITNKDEYITYKWNGEIYVATSSTVKPIPKDELLEIFTIREEE